MPQIIPNLKSDPLILPFLSQEPMPTQNDFRTIQLWAQQQPLVAITSVMVGKVPPSNIQPVHVSGCLLVEAIPGISVYSYYFSDLFNFTFSYGYNVILQTQLTASTPGYGCVVMPTGQGAGLSLSLFSFIFMALDGSGPFPNAGDGDVFLPIVYDFFGA